MKPPATLNARPAASKPGFLYVPWTIELAAEPGTSDVARWVLRHVVERDPAGTPGFICHPSAIVAWLCRTRIRLRRSILLWHARRAANRLVPVVVLLLPLACGIDRLDHPVVEQAPSSCEAKSGSGIICFPQQIVVDQEGNIVAGAETIEPVPEDLR